jgi:prolyl-tRNA synthetase
MVMTHGDDKGLVLPPKVAPIQVIVIPVPYKDADTTAIKGACESTVYTLNQSGIRADQDTRENYSPGWKYSHWEMKGVPLRIEIGPKDLANKQVPTTDIFMFKFGRIFLLPFLYKFMCHLNHSCNLASFL